MKIAMVSTSDLGHGAGVSAYNLMKDFELTDGLLPRMFVSEKKSDSIYVHQLLPQKKIFGKPLEPYFSKIETFINLYGPQNYYSVRSKALLNGINDFNPDIVNLHSIHWDRRNFTPKIIQDIKDKPIIWTIHDMWAFTGHCCYSDDCEKWKVGCGNCERLSPFIPIKNDMTSILMKLKKKWYHAKNLTVVAPSKWLYNLAKESYLFDGIDVRYIPYSVNQETFFSKNVLDLRNSYCGTKQTILFSCSWLQDPRKGFDDLYKAMYKIKNKLHNVVLLVAGIGVIPKELSDIIEVKYFGEVHSRDEMNNLYNMSDFFVMPTKMDNLPNAILEALATATPVIAYSTGGVPDMIQDQINGFLVDRHDIDTLSKRIAQLLDEKNLLEQFSVNALSSINNNFTRTLQAERYKKLFEEKLGLQKLYPCKAAFQQVYLIPRENIDFRFCPYHEYNAVDFEDISIHKLKEIFNKNSEIQRRRQAYLKGDFLGAGCKEGCLELSKFRETGLGYKLEDFTKEDGFFEPATIWLSMGPDCNISCRYCLDVPSSKINYKTCNPDFMNLAKDLVLQGGSLLLTGGEPTLPKYGFKKMLQTLSAYDVKGKIWLQTNGTNLNDELAQLIINSPVYAVGVSFDTYKKDLFNYLRRGADFDQVFSNFKNLRDMRDKYGTPKLKNNEKLKLVILCAVLKSTADHLIETVDFFMNEGFHIDLNNLHEAVFAPTFCKSEGLHNLSLKELEKLYQDVIYLGEKYQDRLSYLGLQGQVDNIIKYKKQNINYQVNLTGKDIS